MNPLFPQFVQWLKAKTKWLAIHRVEDTRLNSYRFYDERAQAAYEGWVAAHQAGYSSMESTPTETGLYEVVWSMSGLHGEKHMVSAFVPFCTCHGWAKHQVDIWANHSKKSASVLSRGLAWRKVATMDRSESGMQAWFGDQFPHPAEDAA